MLRIADDLYLLDGTPLYTVNVYFTGKTLIDAGTRLAKNRIIRQLNTLEVTTHVLTHCHPDHQGSSKAICEAFDIPLWCGEADRYPMETGDYSKTVPGGKARNRMAGPPHPVAKTLKEGDEIDGFTVIETPGHTPGHISFWRESDKVVILGDVLFGMNFLTWRNGLYEPFKQFTLDPAQNRDSARKIAALQPEIICFGHGSPLHDPEKFQAYVASLP